MKMKIEVTLFSIFEKNCVCEMTISGKYISICSEYKYFTIQNVLKLQCVDDYKCVHSSETESPMKYNGTCKQSNEMNTKN